jgi:prepilin-type N-terminal cleavage/methylation domain-containing protein
MNDNRITNSTRCLGKSFSRKGFTLIEIAFVLVIIGILAGFGAQMIPMLVKQSKLKDNRELVKEARIAIIGYAIANGKLPCADGSTPNKSLPRNGSNGIATLGTYNGFLPWATLGINGNDAYQNTLFYAVDSNLTTTTPATFQTTIGKLINGTIAPDLFCDNGNMKVAFVVLSGGENLRADPPNDDTGDGFITMGDNNQFASPSASITSNYDDIVEAVSLTSLLGLLPTPPLLP